MPAQNIDLLQALAPLQRPAPGKLVLIRDGDNALLCGTSHALYFIPELDGIEVLFAELAAEGRVNWYSLRKLMFERFVPEDRALFGTPAGIAQRLAASAEVVVCGLSKRCPDVLVGPGAWLRRDGWAVSEPSARTSDIVRSNGASSSPPALKQ